MKYYKLICEDREDGKMTSYLKTREVVRSVKRVREMGLFPSRVTIKRVEPSNIFSFNLWRFYSWIQNTEHPHTIGLFVLVGLLSISLAAFFILFIKLIMSF